MLTLMCLKRVTILWVTEGMGEEDRVPKTPGEDVQGPAGPSPCGGGSQSDRNPDQAQALGAAGCGGVWMAARRARWAPGPVPEEVEVASLGWEQSWCSGPASSHLSSLPPKSFQGIIDIPHKHSEMCPV